MWQLCTGASFEMVLVRYFQLASDSLGDVREASFQALGTAMKVVGEKPLIPFLAEVDSIKMAKVIIE